MSAGLLRSKSPRLPSGFPFFVDSAEHKQTAAQKELKKDFEKKVQLCTEVPPEGQVYTDCPPRAVQRPESAVTGSIPGTATIKKKLFQKRL